jgi:hypothetical protein
VEIRREGRKEEDIDEEISWKGGCYMGRRIGNGRIWLAFRVRISLISMGHQYQSIRFNYSIETCWNTFSIMASFRLIHCTTNYLTRQIIH